MKDELLCEDCVSHTHWSRSGWCNVFIVLYFTCPQHLHQQPTSLCSVTLVFLSPNKYDAQLLDQELYLPGVLQRDNMSGHYMTKTPAAGSFIRSF